MRSGWASGLGLRAASAVVMIAVALLAVAAGPHVFALFIAAGAVVLAWEWTRLTGAGRFGATGVAMAVMAVATVVVAVLGRFELAVLCAAVASAVVYLVALREGRGRKAWLAAGPLYIGLPAIALVLLRGSDEAGRMLIVWLLLVVAATDIGAFFAGRIVGGPRLAPRISPNKTWAGLVGGMAGAAIAGSVAGAAIGDAPATALLAAAGAMLALVAQAGDLGESWVKRRFGAKDSSRLIPGHGGLFDRVDGLIAAAAALALWQWLGGAALSWR